MSGVPVGAGGTAAFDVRRGRVFDVPFRPVHLSPLSCGRSAARDKSFLFHLRSSVAEPPKGAYNSGSPNVKTTPPEGMLMYCFPSISYVIGDVTRRLPVFTLHSNLPVSAWSAIK